MESRQIRLYNILSEYAVTKQEKDKVAVYYKSICQTWKTDTARIECALAGAIYDGLAYGNWPWGSIK